MAADLKSLQDALSSLTAFIAPLEAHRKYVEQCGATMKAYEKVSEALEKQLGDLINELKKTKNNTLSEADENPHGAGLESYGGAVAGNLVERRIDPPLPDSKSCVACEVHGRCSS